VGYWGAQKPDPGLRCPLDRTHPLARGLWGAWIFNQYAGRFWEDAVTSRLIDMTGPVHTRGGLILQNGLGRYGSIQGGLLIRRMVSLSPRGPVMTVAVRGSIIL